MKNKVRITLCAIVCLFLMVCFNVSQGNAISNKELCEEWCKSHPKLCDKCSDNAGCGYGYDTKVTFKFDSSSHWHACYGMPGSERNRKACEDWCNQNKDPKKVHVCEKCSDHQGCGTGYESILSFKGEGKDYHACGKTLHRRQSEGHKEECIAWCEENRDKGCVKCDTLRYCGQGYEPMKHFEGPGINWHACKKK